VSDRSDPAGASDRPSVVVSAQSVSKWYGQVIALNDVTTEVSSGVLGLLGPNGAGKSTFMKLVAGQLRPSQGLVSVFGRPIWGNPAVYARIGYCPDQDAFYERMTGVEWLTALVRLHGLDEDAARDAARRALDVVGLAEVATRRIGAYSKGMRQRVKLAQAIAHDPDLLLLDEPLTGMDPIGRRRTIKLIREWGRTGKTVVVSSHILHEIELMTSTILLIDHGRILAEGNVHQIRDLIDEHPHKVSISASDPRRVAGALLQDEHVISMNFSDDTLVVETDRPDAFYTRLTALAASGEAGAIDEVTSPDDNLQAVFEYLVRS